MGLEKCIMPDHRLALRPDGSAVETIHRTFVPGRLDLAHQIITWPDVLAEP
jgi:hypothetical protein